MSNPPDVAPIIFLSNPTSESSFVEFQRTMLAKMASGFVASYEQVAADFVSNDDWASRSLARFREMKAIIYFTNPTEFDRVTAFDRDFRHVHSQPQILPR